MLMNINLNSFDMYYLHYITILVFIELYIIFNNPSQTELLFSQAMAYYINFYYYLLTLDNYGNLLLLIL